MQQKGQRVRRMMGTDEERDTIVPAATIDAIFTRVSARYDRMNDLLSVGFHRIWKARAVDALYVSRTRPFRHLDLAGGTGDLARAAIRRSPTVRTVVVDRNVHMLAVGRSRKGAGGTGTANGAPPAVGPFLPQVRFASSEQAISPIAAPTARTDTASTRSRSEGGRLHFVVADAVALPFPDRFFDGCTLAFGIRNMEDRLAALREVYRCLKQGGRFVCLEFSRPEHPVLACLYERYRQHIVPLLGECVAKDRAAYDYLQTSIAAFPDAPAVGIEMSVAGFSRVRHEKLSGGIVALITAWRN